jgi:salicylate synthase
MDEGGALFALVSAGIFDSYVAYARPRDRWFAGNSLGELVMRPREIQWTSTGGSGLLRMDHAPLRQLGDIAKTWPLRGHRMYGYLAFECGHLIHRSAPVADTGQPLAHLVVPEVEVRWDQAGTTISSRNRTLLGLVVDVLESAGEAPVTAATPVRLDSSGARRHYEAAVAGVIDAILAGLLRKAIISRRVDVPFAVDLPRSYLSGLRMNTPARSFLLDLGGRRLAGFSPESVVEVSSHGRVRTEPLAGTRPLPANPEERMRLREELMWDVKECYEHVISARLGCEELASVCDPGSIHVQNLMSVKERGTVQHLASSVAGTLDPRRDAWDAAQALFPAVTVSGLPKRQALEMIRNVEGQERGLYGGAVCMVGPDGSMDAALVLRSIFQDANGTWLQAGAGIVEKSLPPLEFDETTSKLQSAAGCLVQAQQPDREGNLPLTSATNRNAR